MIFYSFFLHNTVNSQAQTTNTVTLNGSVVNPAGRPVPSLTISLRSDSAIIQRTVTSQTGSFQFNSVQAGTYIITAAGIGFKTMQTSKISVVSAMKLPPLIVHPEAAQLREVAISRKPPALKMQDGKLIFDVQQSPVASGSSAFDILLRAPGVTADQDDNLQLKGSSAVTVLVDGKMTYLSGSQLANRLKGMGASQISKIEMISTPSAEFDAAGNAGIINIVLKKNTAKGYALDLTGGAGSGRYFQHRESTAGNIRTDRFNVFGNLGYEYRHTLAKRTGEQENPGGAIINRRLNDVIKSKYYTYRGGIELNVGGNQEVGFLYTGYTDDWSRDASGPTIVTGTSNSEVRNRYVQLEPYYNDGFNLNYKLQLDTNGRFITANADYISYRNHSDGYLGNTWTDAAGYEMLPYQQLNFHQPSLIGIRSVKTDMELPYHQLKVKAGLKYSSVTIDNDFRYDSLQASGFVPAPTLSDHFVYTERIAAAYLSAGKRWKNTHVDLGLRIERTYSDGNSISGAVRTLRNYTDLFPSLSLGHELSGSFRLDLAVSRRINRPTYFKLNPVRYFSDKFAYSQGNPDLLPERAWIYTLTGTINKDIIVTLTVNRTGNFIAQTVQVGPVPDVLVTSSANFSHQDRYDLLLVKPFRILSSWKVNSTVGLSHTSYPVPGARRIAQAAVDLLVNNSIDLPSGIAMELTGHYASPTLNGMYRYRAYGSVDAGFRKSFMKKKVDARVAFSDIFHQMNYSAMTVRSLVLNRYYNKPDSRRVNLTLTMHVGGKLNRGRMQEIEEQDRL
nr:outer membrane beta-barrel protein [Hufsiella ginkgonis]